MDYNISEHIQKTENTMRIEAQEIPERFIPLPWSIIKRDGGLMKMSNIG